MNRLIGFAISACMVIIPVSATAQEQTAQPWEQQAEQTQPEQMPEHRETHGGVIIPDQREIGPAGETGLQAAEGQPALKNGRYTIRQGDTLWDISNAFLKDPFLWPLIWKVNPYIKNPDLIYPGNRLVIPSLAPIERAMAAPSLDAEGHSEQVQPEDEGLETEVAALPPVQRPATPKSEEQTVTTPRVILPEEKVAPLIDKYSMINAGYIAQEETDDIILGSPDEKTIFAYDDVVYLRIKSRENVQIGDRFLIYKPLNKVRHPHTGKKYGRLIKVLGIVKIIAKDKPDVLTGRITLSFDAIDSKSLLAPYQEPTLIYPRSEKTDKSIEPGYILEVVDGRTINAQTDIVYIDRGSADGVEPGDRFSVIIEPQKDRPRKILGEILVFLVKEHTSTGIVRKSVDTLARGDMVEYKK